MAKAKKIISAERAAQGHVVVEGGLQVHGLGGGVGAVESAHGGDHDFAGQHAGEQADADLPVEAERGDGRLDEVAESADDAVGEFGRGVGAAGERDTGRMREHPEGQRDAENDGAGLAEEDAARGRQGAAPSERSVGMRYCGSSRMKGVSLDLRMELLSSHAVVMAATKPATIEAEHDDGAQAEESVQEDDVGNEGGDEQHVDRQARRAGHEGRDEDGGEAVALFSMVRVAMMAGTAQA